MVEFRILKQSKLYLLKIYIYILKFTVKLIEDLKRKVKRGNIIEVEKKI